MSKTTKRNAWSFVPTQYFAEGLPYVIVNTLSVALYKSLGISNELIGYTSFLYLPWAIKPLWSPMLDANKTKRGWVVLTQLLLAVIFGLLAFGVQLPDFFYITLILFTVAAFVSATHDIATDGYYLHALDHKEQAFFTGIRSTFYRLSMIFGSGILVTLAGSYGNSGGELVHGWSISLVIAAILFFVFFLYHRYILPYPKTDAPVRDSGSSIPFAEVFRLYFTQKKIIVILLFILLYRLGEGMLVKMAQPFLMDDLSKGGLGISVAEIGVLYGTFGVLALVIGGILGGILIKRYGLRKLIWPMVFAMNLPNLLYVYLSAVKPSDIYSIDFSFLSEGWIFNTYPIVQLCVIIEQFGYGLGFTAFMVYLLYVSKGKYKTSFYAISTGIMAVGMMLPGFVSGVLQEQLGYTGLFILSSVMTIPGMLVIFFLPMDFSDEN